MRRWVKTPISCIESCSTCRRKCEMPCFGVSTGVESCPLELWQRRHPLPRPRPRINSSPTVHPAVLRRTPWLVQRASCSGNKLHCFWFVFGDISRELAALRLMVPKSTPRTNKTGVELTQTSSTFCTSPLQQAMTRDANPDTAWMIGENWVADYVAPNA